MFEKHEIALAYLFGSQARGSCKEDSDYGIAVLFDRGRTWKPECNEEEVGK